jgi:hypothetical protein
MGVVAGATAFSRSRASSVVLLSVVFLLSVLGGATTARAFSDYTSSTWYVQYENMSPGTTRFSSGWNNRTENSACRTDNGGQDSVQYINTNNVYVYNAGPIYTNCQNIQSVSLFNNGYFKTSCYNAGTVVHNMSCIAWNYIP